MAVRSEDLEKNTVQCGSHISSVLLNGPESDGKSDREAFLSSFTAGDDREIMKKVDNRFLWLIGLMYILKNVGPTIDCLAV
jgi:hypothetical protein